MKKDILIPISCIIIIIISSILLYIDFTKKIDYSGTEQIGIITFKKRIAERKYAGEVIWETIEKSAPLYNYDSLKTSESSLSVIKFKDNTEVELGENTFILLTWSKEEGAKINFTKGSISARAKTKDSKINIISDGAKIQVDNGDIQISKNEKEKKIELNVTSGSAVVETNKGTEEIKEDKIATISQNKTEIKQKTLKPKKPISNKYFVILENKKRITFAWELDANASVNHEISTSIDFKKISKSTMTNKKSISLDLTPGTYFWRIVKKGKDGETSEIRKLTIMNERPVQPILPQNNSSFQTYIGKAPISFQWTKSQLASSYEVIISKNKTLNPIYKKIKSNLTNITTEDIPVGNYYWSVINIYDFGNIEPINNNFISNFKIQKEKDLPVTQIISPEDNQTISSLKLINDNIVCNWTSSDEINEYELQLSSDMKFSNILFSRKTKNNFIKLSYDFKPGNYFIRVMGISEKGKKSKASPIKKFLIKKTENIITSSPLDGSYLDIEKNPKILFSWEDPNAGNNYRLELSKNKQFSEILYSKNTDENNTYIRKEFRGKFYWRVLLQGKNNKVIAESNISYAIISEKLEAPEIISPKKNSKLDMTYKNKIRFDWTEVKNATHYNFKFYHYGDSGERLIMSKQLKNSNFIFNNLLLLDKGNFYCEVQALIVRNNKITKSSKAVTRYFSILLKEPEKEPELVTPNIIYVK